MTGPSRFLFLNEERDVTAATWDAAHVAKLWRYNLHYFDDLNSEAAEKRASWHRDLVKAWIAENPPGRGSGWEPYPVSLRVVNWIKWALAGNPLSSPAQNSLATQTRWLARRMEWHLLGNHLFANAKALVFAGLFFSGEEARRWLQTGLRVLDTQLSEQVLNDGGQFERSPMYHALALEDLLDLANAARIWPEHLSAPQVDSWRTASVRMLQWLQALSHPDGGIALFNDSAFDIAPTLKELTAYATRLNITAPHKPGTVEHLAASGYVCVRHGPFVLFCDVGDIGPDYLPGHAHADTLSFELSVFGERWFVDSGCSTYEIGKQRSMERGTAAHNTIVVDGLDSSEVWSSFRVARRARARAVSVSRSNGALSISAAHDGYTRIIDGGPIHRRRWTVTAQSIVVADELCGDYHRATGYLHLHPEVHARIEDESTIYLTRGGQELTVRWHGVELSLQQSSWHPGFGRAIPNTVIAAQLSQANPELHITR